MSETGFPSPARDYQDNDIDFNTLIKPFPASVFIFRMRGHALTHLHIQEGDLLAVDRRLPAFDNCLAIITNEEENCFLCRQLIYCKAEKTFLYKENGFEKHCYRIIGVVTFIIRNLRANGLSGTNDFTR